MRPLTPTTNADRSISAASTRPWPLWVVFLLFVAVAAVLHYPGFRAPMLYDSQAGISDKLPVFARHDVPEIVSMVPGRPLFMLSLYLNYLLGGMNPASFRVANVLLLAATGLILTVLSLRILEIANPSGRTTGRETYFISIVLGLLFVAHPLQVFVVLYVWQRQALMACVFYFLALGLYLSSRSRPQRTTLPGYAGTGILFFAGLLSKENVISFPIVLALAEAILFRQTLREMPKRLLTIAGICVPPVLGYFLVNHLLQGPETVHPRGVATLLMENYGLAHLGLLDVVWTQCRVTFSYLLMILVPSAEGFALVRPETISWSLWDPPETAAAVAGVMAWTGLAVLLMRRKPATAFGMLFFLAALAPEGLLSPQYLFFGYRAVLPMAGVLLVVGQVAVDLSGMREKIPWKVQAAAALLAAGYLGVVTFSTARQWSPWEFWKKAFTRLPAFSQRVETKAYLDILVNYSAQLIKRGEDGAALEILGKTLLIAPKMDLAETKIALALEKKGALPEAIEHFRNVFHRNPRDATSATNLGRALFHGGKQDEAIRLLEGAMDRHPRDEAVSVTLALALVEARRGEEGIRILRQYLQRNPRALEARVRLAVILLKMGQFSEAAQHFAKAVDVDPGSVAARRGLGQALEATGDDDGALASYQKAVHSAPDSPDAHYDLGNALVKRGDTVNGMKSLQKAVALRPDFWEAHANLGTALLQVGQIPKAIPHLQKALTGLPNIAELHNLIGVALAETGNARDAESQFRKALSIDPNHAGARENLDRALAGRAETSAN